MGADVCILAGLSAGAVFWRAVCGFCYGTAIEYKSYIAATVVGIGAAIVGCALAGAYDPFRALTATAALKMTVIRVFGVFLVLTGILFVFKISDNFSRFWLLFWATTSIIALAGVRLAAGAVARRLIHRGRITKKLAIVGANEVGRNLAVKLQQEGLGTHVVGLFDICPSQTIDGLRIHEISALDKLLSDGLIDEIIFSISPFKSERIHEFVQRVQPFPAALRVLAPEGFERFRVLGSHRYGEINTFLILGGPVDEGAAIIKWLEDKLLAVLCLFGALPLMLFIAILIKFDSRGPVLFRQKRLGANNREFDLLKFRSMYVGEADPLGRQLTRADDPRITRLGRFLRRTSLDELPQLFNVLRGNMSLVGPRPHALAASAAGVAYASAVDDYPMRHRVKPGMTGWAQVNGWRGETLTIEQIRRRVEHDIFYVENWSLGLDFAILLRTIFVVMSQVNAV